MTRVRLWHITTVLAFAVVVVWMVWAGLGVRRWVWEQTAGIHYVPDMDNAWNWGGRAAREGYFSLYDRVIAESRNGQFGLDYVPLRLGVMTQWARWAKATFPGATGWRADYAFNAPLLWLNTVMEFLAAAGMFFLVRQWIGKERQPLRPVSRRGFAGRRRREAETAALSSSATSSAKPAAPLSPAPSNALMAVLDEPEALSPAPVQSEALASPDRSQALPSPASAEPAASPLPPPTELEAPRRFFDGCWIALIAAGLVWFNASSIFSAHGRPTWDVWVIPFYIWAVFFASRNNWFVAGVLVGVGTMLKGQQLVVAPFFLLWPIFSLRFGAALRWLIGLALAAGLIVSPWQVWRTPNWGPLLLCIAAVLIGPALWAIARRVPKARPFARPRWAVWISGFCLAGALWCTPLLFPVSTAWMKVGFIYGIEKMPNLETGNPSSLAAILQHRYGWDSDAPAATLPFTSCVLSMKALLLAIGYGLIALSAAAAAWHAKKHDRRFLLAAAAPWLVYFAVFPQMHERYLLWASLMTAAAVSISVGLTGLNLLLTAFSWVMGMDQLLRDGRAHHFGRAISPTFGRSLLRFTHGTFPDSGWAILVICLVWLWAMFAVRRRE